MLLGSHHGSPEHLRNPPPPPTVVCVSVKRFQLPVWRQTEAVNQTRAEPRVSTYESAAHQITAALILLGLQIAQEGLMLII